MLIPTWLTGCGVAFSSFMFVPWFVSKRFSRAIWEKNVENEFCSFYRAQSFAERLRLGIAVIHGEAQDAESDLVDGRHSPPTVKNSGAIHPSLEIPCENLISANSLSLFYFFSLTIPYCLFFFLHSADSQRKTPNNCCGRCRWTNCHHSGEFKMIWLSSGSYFKFIPLLNLFCFVLF